MSPIRLLWRVGIRLAKDMTAHDPGTGLWTRRNDVTSELISLDEHRSVAARRETRIRLRRSEADANLCALQSRALELERTLSATPSRTWPEAAEKARYLLALFATTAPAQDPLRQRLIVRVLEDFKVLSELPAEPVPVG